MESPDVYVYYADMKEQANRPDNRAVYQWGGWVGGCHDEWLSLSAASS